MPASNIEINGAAASNDDLPISVLVQLTNADVGGETTYLWTLVDKPLGSLSTISNVSIENPTITPDSEGTYLLQLTVNGTLINRKIFAVRQLKTRERIPAAGETTENDAADGWAGATGASSMLRLVDAARADPGVYVAYASVAGLVPGNVVRVVNTVTIKAGLPGQEKVPSVNKALAANAAEVDGPLGVVIAGVNGSATPAINTLVYIRVFGRFGTTAGAPAVGDPVYVSNTGTLSLTAGTNKREIGQVMYSAAGQFDTYVSGLSGVLFGGVNTTRSVLYFGNLEGDPTGGATWYCTPGTEHIRAVNVAWTIVMPTAGTVKNLYVWCGGAPNDDVIFTVMKNAVASAVTATLIGGTTSIADVTHSFTVAAGDRIAIRAVNDGGVTTSANTVVNASVELET